MARLLQAVFSGARSPVSYVSPADLSGQGDSDLPALPRGDLANAAESAQHPRLTSGSDEAVTDPEEEKVEALVGQEKCLVDPGVRKASNGVHQELQPRCGDNGYTHAAPAEAALGPRAGRL